MSIDLHRWACCFVLTAACSGDPEPPGGANFGCTDAGICTLREAGAAAGVHVGVAAAPLDDTISELIVREFDSLSPEGELLWNVVHPERDRWDFEEADRVLDFAAEHGLITTVSHFVWDQALIGGTPDWVKAIDDPDELRSEMREHLRTLSDRYGTKIDRWIVVNEPQQYTGSALYQSHFRQVLGADYIAQTFRIARDEAPDAKLWLNEIFTENDASKADALVAIAEELVADGVPIDGVSLQGHLFYGAPDVTVVEDTLRRIAALDLETAITEIDAPEVAVTANREEIQSLRIVDLVGACLAVPACESITFWGLHDGQSWINWLLGPDRGPLLLDETLAPKPQYFAVRDALARGRPMTP